ncbi:MAG: DNA primase [Candidatus Latescibacteria bacterium]|nr:DNA primase [Candidatus Latescibacterota bacterium]
MAYRIPEETIEELRERTDIVELVSEYVSLKKRGKNYFGLCPFHPEKTPSFSVNPEKQIYHCFGCKAGGNAFSFLMETQKISFLEAVRILAERAGVSLPEPRSEGKKDKTNDLLYQANEFAQKYFHHLLLKDKRAEKARAYLKGRLLSEKIVQEFGLGYSPSDWDGLLKVATQRSISGTLLEKSGLAIKRDDGGFYDRFRDRIMFPIQDRSGRTVAFGARALEDSQEPKYLNSPETPIYQKSFVLYGLRQARDAIRKAERAIVVEGYTDLLRLVEAGIGNVVASSGTALTKGQAGLLCRYTHRVALVYDADLAGSAAAFRGIDTLLEADLGVNVVSLPKGYDPDSFVREKGGEAFQDLLGQAKEALDYKLEAIAKTQDLTTVEGKREAIAQLVETALRIKDEIKRDLIVRQIVERLNTDEKAVHREMARQKKRQRAVDMGQAPPTKTKDTEPQGPVVQRELLRIMLGRKTIAEEVMKELSPEDFSAGGFREIAQTIFEVCRAAGEPQAAVIIDRLQEPSLASFVAKLSTEGLDENYIEECLIDCLHRVRIDAISEKLSQIRTEIATAQREGDETRLGKLNQQYNNLVKEKAKLVVQKT